MIEILATVFFLLVPVPVIVLCRRIKALEKIGPVLILYAAGIIFGNLVRSDGLEKVQEAVTDFTVTLAIPLLLFGCKFRRTGTRSQFLALVTGLVAVVIAALSGFFIFGKHIPGGAAIGGMLTGVYTGGTVNMAALKTMLGVPDTSFVLLNSYDMLASFVYLTFLMTAGIRLFRKWLPRERGGNDKEASDAAVMDISEDRFRFLLTKSGIRNAAVLLAVCLAIAAVSAGIALLCGKTAFMPVFILSLTTFGIAASFWKPVKKRKGGDEIGMYLIYVFSVAVASMADLGSFSIGENVLTLAYLTFIIFGALAIQFTLAKIFKIDSDTTVISSVTYICSPPFVPMMAAAMKNRSVLTAGLTIGVVGYAVGNYLGFGIAKLLEYIF